jgi:hypothetical protein
VHIDPRYKIYWFIGISWRSQERHPLLDVRKFPYYFWPAKLLVNSPRVKYTGSTSADLPWIFLDCNRQISKLPILMQMISDCSASSMTKKLTRTYYIPQLTPISPSLSRPKEACTSASPHTLRILSSISPSNIYKSPILALFSTTSVGTSKGSNRAKSTP